MHSGTAVAEQFADAPQQKLAVTMGMWTFLATEVLFFGGMFVAYVEYRTAHRAAFVIGSAQMDFWLGMINTAVLLVSSFTMAAAVRAAKLGRGVQCRLLLLATLVLGAAFLGIKGTEYWHHWRDGLVPGPGFSYHGRAARALELFMSFYFVMTGVHALHMLIGLGVVSCMLLFARRSTPVEVAGLYWHFVDLVWIFLYPCFYLVS